jgi:hypothetical protein
MTRTYLFATLDDAQAHSVDAHLLHNMAGSAHKDADCFTLLLSASFKTCEHPSATAIRASDVLLTVLPILICGALLAWGTIHYIDIAWLD